MAALAFWLGKKLDQMSQHEWEQLCDGCGKCCLHKLEDEDDGQVYYTNIACRYLSETDCRCRSYSERLQLVPDCIDLKPQDVSEFHWLPSTCSYRLIAEQKPLPQWHHLVCGDPQAVHRSGNSVQGKVIPEGQVDEDDYEECIVHWVE
ncbi:MAG: YcgN family cysteine cluster protein [Pseudomonadota bacterium]|nr:YcgN family cysteine cluster protein [Pseudomonadota bacterium]